MSFIYFIVLKFKDTQKLATALTVVFGLVIFIVLIFPSSKRPLVIAKKILTTKKVLIIKYTTSVSFSL